MPAEGQKEVRQLVGLFENALAGLLLDGQWKTFTASTPEQQDARIRSWQQSRLEVRRTGYRALKKIVYSSYYGARETWARHRLPRAAPDRRHGRARAALRPRHHHRGGSAPPARPLPPPVPEVKP